MIHIGQKNTVGPHNTPDVRYTPNPVHQTKQLSGITGKFASFTETLYTGAPKTGQFGFYYKNFNK